MANFHEHYIIALYVYPRIIVFFIGIKKQIFQLNKHQEKLLSVHETIKKELSTLKLAVDEGPHSNKSSSTSLGGRRLTPNSSLKYKTLDMCSTDEVWITV